MHRQVEIRSRDDEISDHVSSLEVLVDRLNKADSLLRVKEEQVEDKLVIQGCLSTATLSSPDIPLFYHPSDADCLDPS
jgi:hypothetical protein